MKLLPKLPKIGAKKVENFSQIREDARDMLLFLNGDNFQGKYRDGFALSHAQISEKPLQFFVTHRSWSAAGTMPEIIINARIVEKMQREPFREACLSYPFRDAIWKQRYWRIEVEYDVPSWYAGLPFSNGLKHEQQTFDGIAAIIFQHEIEHAHAVDMYVK